MKRVPPLDIHAISRCDLTTRYNGTRLISEYSTPDLQLLLGRRPTTNDFSTIAIVG